MTFEKGQLVQVYRNNLAGSLSTTKKIQPMWTGPWRVTEWLLNSYKLATLEGELLKGDYSARRLREFVPREGTELAAEQKAFETALKETDQITEIQEGLEPTTESNEHREVNNPRMDDLEMDKEEREGENNAEER